jgi:hypothetical protein
LKVTKMGWLPYPTPAAISTSRPSNSPCRVGWGRGPTSRSRSIGPALWRKAQGEFEPQHFLDLSGDDPRQSLARKLIKACGRKGPILVYSQAMEAGVIRALAAQQPDLADDLLALLPRFVDLLPLMREHYYHPAMDGRWSLKSVLLTIAPKLGYDRLDGVADGLAAQDAYL